MASGAALLIQGMILFNRRISPTGLVFLLILGAILFYHWRGLQPGYAFLPVTLGQSLQPWRATYGELPPDTGISADALYIHYTFLQFNIRELQARRFPLWDSGILGGHPAVADPLYQIFYPVWTWLALLIGNVARAYTLGIGLHVLLAAGSMYALSRTWGHSQSGAVVAAFTYALGGAMVVWMEMALNLGTLAWFPAILCAYERATQQGSWKWTVAAAGCFMLGCFAGHIQYMATFALFWGLYAIGKMLAYRYENGVWKKEAILHFSVAIGLGTLAALPLLLPLTEFLELTRRTTGPGLQSPFPLPQLLTLLVPNYFGTPVTGEYWGANYTETTIYTGVVGFILAIVAPFASKRFMARYVALMVIPLAYLMLGGPGVAALGEVALLKFINQTRVFVVIPLALALLAAETLTLPRLPRLAGMVASLAVLAIVGVALYANFGQGRDHFEQIQGDIYRMGGLIGGLLLLLWGVTLHPNGRRWAGWGMAFLVFCDLYLWGGGYNPVGRVDEVIPPLPVIEALHRTDGYRTIAIQRDHFVFGMNLLSSFGIPEAGGYSSLVYRPILRMVTKGDPDNAFGLPRYSNLLLFNRPTERLLELLQVKQVVSLYPLNGTRDEYALSATRWQVRQQSPLYIYEDKSPLPRSAVYYDFEVIEDEVAAIARLHEASFPINERVVVYEDLAFTPTPHPATPATIIEATPQRVVIEATAAQSGLLVFGEMNYPGWVAVVDGEAAPVVTANGVWRGVVISEGTHRVELLFRPTRLYWGIAGAGIAVALSILLMWRRK